MDDTSNSDSSDKKRQLWCWNLILQLLRFYYHSKTHQNLSQFLEIFHWMLWSSLISDQIAPLLRCACIVHCARQRKKKLIKIYKDLIKKLQTRLIIIAKRTGKPFMWCPSVFNSVYHICHLPFSFCLFLLLFYCYYFGGSYFLLFVSKWNRRRNSLLDNELRY